MLTTEKMKDKYPHFFEAAKDIDGLTIEGFFGDSAKELSLNREVLGQAKFYSACMEDWLKDTNQYGKAEVKKLIFIFLKLYAVSIQAGGQKAIDSITCFLIGNPENPETESLSSFTEFLRYHVEAKNFINGIKGKINVSLSEKKRLCGALSVAYSKGVELISKILNTCISLLEIANCIATNESKTFNLPLWKKIKRFKELSNDQFYEIILSIDRDIRNADAHLNLWFSTEKGVFKYKVKDGKRLKMKEISAEKFILDKYPKIGWVAQGFVYSSILLILAHVDQESYHDKVQKIIRIA